MSKTIKHLFIFYGLLICIVGVSAQSDCKLCNQIDSILEEGQRNIPMSVFDSLSVLMERAAQTCPECKNGNFNLWETALYQYRVIKDVTNQKIALHRYKEAYEDSDWDDDTLAFDLELTVLLREGYYYSNLEDYEAAKRNFQKIISRIQGSQYYNYSIHETKNIAYQNLGRIEVKRGNWNKALSMYQYAIDDEVEYAKAQNRDPIVFSIYAYLGEIYALKGDHERAYLNYEISNQILVKKMKEKSKSQMTALVYQYLQRFLGQVQEAIELKRWTDVDRLFNIIATLPLLPDNASNIKIDLAKLDYHIARGIEKTPNFDLVYDDISRFPDQKSLKVELLLKKLNWQKQHNQTKDYEITLSQLTTIIDSNPKEFEKEKLMVFNHKMADYKTLGNASQVTEFLHQLQNEIDERLSNDLIFEDHLQSATQYYEIIESGLDFLYTSKSQNYELIFDLIEKIKSIKLVDTYRASIKRGSSTDTNVSEFKFLTTLTGELKRTLSNTPNNTSVSKQLFEAEERLTFLRSQLAKNDENVLNDIDLAAFMGSLSDNEAYMSFFSGKTHNYILYLSHQNQSFIRTSTSELKTIALQLYDQLSTVSDIQTLNENSKRFLDLIRFDESIQNVNQLKISADDFASLIPFEAMMGHDEKYLVERFNIHYTPSAKMDNILRKSERNRSNKLAIFSPNINSQPSLFLPYSYKEIEGIQRSFDSNIFIGNQATINNFTSSFQDFNILHLITHGLSIDDNPSNYYIVFSDSTQEVSKLYYDDISAYSLSAKMVCLSACQTAKGNNYIAEGSQSLSKNFMAAGCKSVVSALWNISGQTTSEIFSNFYNHLSKGKSKSEALAQAKKDFFKAHSSEELHPYYWAGLVLAGDNSTIQNATIFTSMNMFIAGTLLMIVLVWIFKKT